MRRTIGPITFGLVACTLLSACGRGEEKSRELRVTAAQQCEGTLSPVAAKALTTALRAERFKNREAGGLERTVRQLASDYEKGERWSFHPDMCEVKAQTGTTGLDVHFGLYDPSDLIGDGRVINMHPYQMGREAHTGFKRAYLFLECTSPRLEGSAKAPARIQGTLDLDKPYPPDTVPIREANLTILHSVALAVVKELGCKNDAGLTEKPILEAK
ncbi:hypothetical protein [Streptomyces sp. NPDC048577]|uniref:hypothetical protein n=1 Tax=Streptomyces sp. NPDC048577 TaxID=3157209 RepID=UPI0034482407